MVGVSTQGYLKRVGSGRIVSVWIGDWISYWSFCVRLLQEEQVWTSSGRSFGENQQDYIRLTILSPIDQSKKP